jgi:hypothetical protein
MTVWFGARPSQICSCEVIRRASIACLKTQQQAHHRRPSRQLRTFGRAGAAHVAGALAGVHEPQKDCCHAHEPMHISQFGKLMGLDCEYAA